MAAICALEALRTGDSVSIPSRIES
jgi:hypothetical protein